MANRKLFPLVVAATSAGALFLAGLLGEALGEELKNFFAPILPHWKWWLGGGLVITILSVLWDRWHADAPDETAAVRPKVKYEVHHHHAPEISPPSAPQQPAPLASAQT